MALYVVLHHSLPHEIFIGAIDVGFILRFGQEAVIIFFLLSGFVINLSHSASSDRSFRLYFTKRFARIYIPLVIALASSYILLGLKNGSLPSLQLETLIMNLLMLQDIGAIKPNVLAEPYLGNLPLWSLSYEWWFYMLYFPITKYIPLVSTQDRLVFGVSIAAGSWYALNPEFLPRILMYFGIWWTGVYLSRACAARAEMDFRKIAIPLMALSTIAVILFVNLIFQVKNGGHLALGLHPVLELRHILFAGLALVLAVAWHRLNWVGFWALRPFLVLAPISYCIYISHYFLMVRATYLGPFESRITEYLSYFIAMIVFSATIELLIYPRARRWMLQSDKAQAISHEYIPSRKPACQSD